MALNSQHIEAALRHLKKADPILRTVIRKTGPCRLKPRRDRFDALVSSILSQQISAKAAASIRLKLTALLAPKKITPENLAALTPAILRTAGISNAKAKYLLDLATRVVNGDLRLERLSRLSDEKVIAQLIEVKGIGVWTAQMFLIFSLGRPDVFPHDDYGVRTAIKKLYDLSELPDKATSHRIAAPWRPYASIAAWYCWRSLDIAGD